MARRRHMNRWCPRCLKRHDHRIHIWPATSVVACRGCGLVRPIDDTKES